MIQEDLRSCLYEDPRNLDALMALIEFYHSRNDSRRVIYYLKQVQFLFPGSPRIKLYEGIYAGQF
jgi:hypothetical protein